MYKLEIASQLQKNTTSDCQLDLVTLML